MKRIFALLLLSVFLVSVLLTGCAGEPVTETIASAEPIPEVSEESVYAEPEVSAEPSPTLLAFTPDRYKLPVDAEDYLAEIDAAADWALLIDAVYDHAPSVTLSGPEAAQRTAVVFAATPYAALAELTAEEDQISFTYNENCSIQVLERAVNAMVDGLVFEESNSLEILLALYQSAAFNCTYEESEDNSLYRMLVENKGGDKEFAAVLQYLFTQFDIPAWIVSGTASDAPHDWVIAEYDGKLYHFDPVFESSATAGLGLSYFGMSDAAHAEAGCAAEYSTGLDTRAETSDSLCPDTQFDALFIGVTGWQADILSHYIFLAYGFDSEYMTSISTEQRVAAAG